MTPFQAQYNQSKDHLQPKGSYGSVSDQYLEESKCPSFSERSSEGGEQVYDMEQMRLMVSSVRQHNKQQEGSEARDMEVPPFAVDENCYSETRQIWLRTIIGVLVGVLGGLLLTKGWSLFQDKPFPANLNSHISLESDYDYIVCGGGPAGVIAATKLAEKLPSARILLLESGSVSQSAVLKALQTQRQNASTTETTMDSNGRISAKMNVDSDTILNKYDIPWMWSGIASTQRRAQSFQLTPDPQSSTYWPIPLALLVRGLGGCGLHNAM